MSTNNETTETTETTIINLTPHPITIVDGDGQVIRTFPKPAVPARAAERLGAVEGAIDGVPVRGATTYGAVEGLPAFRAGTYYIVSLVTVQAARAEGRTLADLLMPGELRRDSAGNIIGCASLVRPSPSSMRFTAYVVQRLCAGLNIAEAVARNDARDWSIDLGDEGMPRFYTATAAISQVRAWHHGVGAACVPGAVRAVRVTWEAAAVSGLSGSHDDGWVYPPGYVPSL